MVSDFHYGTQRILNSNSAGKPLLTANKKCVFPPLSNVRYRHENVVLKSGERINCRSQNVCYRHCGNTIFMAVSNVGGNKLHSGRCFCECPGVFPGVFVNFMNSDCLALWAIGLEVMHCSLTFWLSVIRSIQKLSEFRNTAFPNSETFPNSEMFLFSDLEIILHK